ncbi:gamma-glutamylcyclotransferase [Roseivirga sp. BDSF3-8]|uniref:gamma-glutamylcyclotransferase family protein n=1 Tax=Roseivirga sp. BDSF3-8 TaxID=3241598 RepID=UPI0035326F58
MEKEEILIFVYGTLRVGGSHHHLLGESTTIRKEHILDHYCMYSAGWYPVVVPDSDPDSHHSVVGDVISIHTDLVPKLDVYEGNEFTRKQIELDGIKEPVWIYLLKDSEDTDSYTPLESGDWLKEGKSAV